MCVCLFSVAVLSCCCLLLSSTVDPFEIRPRNIRRKSIVDEEYGFAGNVFFFVFKLWLKVLALNGSTVSLSSIYYLLYGCSVLGMFVGFQLPSTASIGLKNKKVDHLNTTQTVNTHWARMFSHPSTGQKITHSLTHTHAHSRGSFLAKRVLSMISVAFILWRKTSVRQRRRRRRTFCK